MDSMDGYQACREVNQSTKTKDISVVFVTSKNQKADHMWAEMQGGKALVSKPYMAARFSSKSVVSNDSGTAMLPRSRLAGTGGRPGSDYHCQRGLQYGR
jgi:CheY-like chemotaxis protein